MGEWLEDDLARFEADEYARETPGGNMSTELSWIDLKAVRKLVEAERERCAKVVRDWPVRSPNLAMMLLEIETAICSGTND